jgi:Na+/H+ antiporter NhaA
METGLLQREHALREMAMTVSFGFCFLTAWSHALVMPAALRGSRMFGQSVRGIGFTMSISVAQLAFAADLHTINTSKMAILVARPAAGLRGYLWLRFLNTPGTPYHRLAFPTSI